MRSLTAPTDTICVAEIAILVSDILLEGWLVVCANADAIKAAAHVTEGDNIMKLPQQLKYKRIL